MLPGTPYARSARVVATLLKGRLSPHVAVAILPSSVTGRNATVVEGYQVQAPGTRQTQPDQVWYLRAELEQEVVQVVSPSEPSPRSRAASPAATALPLHGLAFAVVGAGRLGSSLALAFERAGARLVGFVCATKEGSAGAEAVLGMARSRDLASLVAADPDLMLLTVPDGALPSVAGAVAEELAASREATTVRTGPPAVLHTSGATPVSVLSRCAEAGATIMAFHPLQTFSDPSTGPERLAGAAVAVTAPTEAGRLLGGRLARAVGARPFALDDADRALYHAAACVASNYLVTLVDVAADLFRRAGLPPEAGMTAFLPLVQGTVENLKAGGDAARALTGPLSRGDTATIEAHLLALEREAPEAVSLYRSLGRRTLDLVRRQERVPDETLTRLERLLTESAAPEPLEEALMNPLSSPIQHSGTVRVITRTLEFTTKGDADMVNITADVRDQLAETGLRRRHGHRLRPGRHRSGHHPRVRARSGAGLPATSSTASARPDRALRAQRHPPGRQRPRPRARRPAGPLPGGPLRRRDASCLGTLAGDLLRLLRQPPARAHGRRADTRRPLDRERTSP